MGSPFSFFGCLPCLSRSGHERPQPPASGASDFLERLPSHTNSTHVETTKVPHSTHNPQPPPNDHTNSPQVTMMHADIDARVDVTTSAPPPNQPYNVSADPTMSIPPAPLEPHASNIHPMIGHPVRLKRNIFALIIGIDDYAGCQKLRGAVADAKSFQAYLEEDLQIPKDQVRTLFDGEATREAIIQAFKDVQNDQRIKENDPIVVFFAGHGGQLSAPLLWGVLITETKIQCLIPQDYNESAVLPIPDRTIGALIEEIAKEKGDNICVILDCCHSASGTRVKNDAYTPRTITLKCTIQADLDQEIWARVGKIAPGFARHGLLSHVLYAACGEKELAYEHQGRGLFTTELLKTLQNNPMDDLTYVEILERLQHVQFVSQNPHCEGVNQHRVIFDVRMPAGRQVRHPVRTAESGKYVFGAGLAHGIGYGVEFTLHDDQKQTVGEMAVDETAVIGDFQTVVTSPKHPVNASFAKVTRVGNLPIYPTPDGDSSQILEETLRRMEANGDVPTFRLVKAVEEAKLEVKIDNGQAVLKVLDRQLKRFGMTNVSFNVKLDYLVHALQAAAHYYWYFDLTNQNKLVDANSEGVAVNFYPLEESEEEYSLKDGLALLVPVKGPGLRTKDVNAELGAIDVIDFVVEKDKLYGIKITNNTARDLYVNAFLFNNGSLSIARYYTQSVGMGKPDPPLKRNGIFTMGYGPGGTAPFEYSLNEGQDVDVGYLKLYFATRPIDLSDVEQVSPFSNTGVLSMDEDARKARLKVPPVMLPCVPTDVWFTLGMPVVQRRRAKQAEV